MSSEPHVRQGTFGSVTAGALGRRDEKIPLSFRFEGDVTVDLASGTSVCASPMVVLRLRAGRNCSSASVVRLRGIDGAT